MLNKKDALDNEIVIPETKEELKEILKEEDISPQLREVYFNLLKIFDYYMDDTPENIMFYSIWIIGTYFHKQFYSYPYLFLNAMRGSGKSRLLKLLASLGNGRYTGNITEPIIFRTSGLLCLDEIEGIGGKDKSNMRELLNASYKRGMTILRTIKKKGIDGDNMMIEEFEPFRPIAMANIWGMEEVLGDRCITRILEKSNNPERTKRIEDFNTNNLINVTTEMLKRCSLCSVVMEKKIELWNLYIDTIHLYTNYINNTNYTNYTFSEEELLFYGKINDSGIYGRNLELFLPLLTISHFIGNDIFEIMLEIAKKMNNEKREAEIQDSSDVLVYQFVSKQEIDLNFTPIKQLFNEFRLFSDLEGEWVNDKWFGRALKRLNLIIEKRRKNSGIEVMVNVAKAREKIKMFQTGSS